ncbi:Tar1p [Candida albicans SC5314]|uniref:Tar1p n=1 Tax=Candida albicans (strain SC5314 / ATCC MYA-2876) TaxID=237561 RepID=A0A1D8PTT5_CANAL|nr:Tar1p [Candida albicans SC5314]AOW31553.1 Tar1p [Candida albicans SC5314]|eukprot:XP_019331110.1 Tar1p [Candida albicans SC5314]
MQNTKSDLKPFPFNNFTYFFTLFSKFFSSFHHCTCSLSVSRQYLALDGIYHPLRAAFPNNSTRRRNFTQTRVISSHGILTLCDVSFQGT